MEVEATGWDGCRDRLRWLEQSGLSEWSVESVGVVEVVEVWPERSIEVVGLVGAVEVDNPIPAPVMSISSVN